MPVWADSDSGNVFHSYILACSHYAKIKTLDKWLVLIELMRSIAKTLALALLI